MNVDTQIKIRNNPYFYQYLRDNSIWYKHLNRDPDNLSKMEAEMKKTYKLNLSDKIGDFGQKIEMIRMFMDIIK